MKLCTDIKQSKKLLEFGIDVNTADMYWSMDEIPYLSFPINDIVTDWKYAQENGMLPAWSLAALLEQFEDTAGLAKDYGLWFCYDNRKSYCTKHYDNPIDACYEMVLKLNELNLL